MKKTTLLIASCFVTTFAFSQFTGTPSGETALSSERQAVIQEQTEDGVNTIVSASNPSENAIILCADDFTISEATTITSITIRGTVNNGLASNITGWDLYIFSDNAGAPGENPANTAGAPLALENVSGAGITVTDDGATAVDVEFDITALAGANVDLDAGTYWVSMGPIMDITDITDNTATGERYNWDSSGDVNGAEPHLIDINDTFGGGFTTYTPFSALGVTVGALAFIVEGDPVLGVDNQILSQVSVYPNPASDVLNVKTPAGVSVNSVAVYDVLGKRSNVSLVNGQINIANLAKGVYILSLDTSAGTLTEKVVKN